MKKIFPIVIVILILFTFPASASAEVKLAVNTTWQLACYSFIAEEHYNWELRKQPKITGSPEFALHDMNGDGEYEVLLYNGDTTHAGALTYAFVFNGQKYVYAGIAGKSPYTFFYYDNAQYPGVFYSDGGMGTYRTEYSTLAIHSYLSAFEYRGDFKSSAYIHEMVLTEEESSPNNSTVTQVTKDDGLFALCTSDAERKTISFVPKQDVLASDCLTFVNRYVKTEYTDLYYRFTLQKDGTAAISSYFGDEKSLTIPSEISGYPVTAIGEQCFSANKTITDVTIPDSVTVIGSSAFSSCRSLRYIDIPPSVVTIGDFAFDECPLEDVKIPDGISKVGYAPFGNAYNRIIISPDHPLLEIIDGTFLMNRQTHTLLSYASRDEREFASVPEGTLAIGKGAFRACGNLKKVSIPDTVTVIGVAAFYRCLNLAEVIIPASVTKIEANAFGNGSNLSLTVTAGSYAEDYAKMYSVPYTCAP